MKIDQRIQHFGLFLAALCLPIAFSAVGVCIVLVMRFHYSKTWTGGKFIFSGALLHAILLVSVYSQLSKRASDLEREELRFSTLELIVLNIEIPPLVERAYLNKRSRVHGSLRMLRDGVIKPLNGSYYHIGFDRIDNFGLMEYDPTNGLISAGDILLEP